MSGKYPKRWISGRSLALYQQVKVSTVMATAASKTFEMDEVVHFSIKLFCASRELCRGAI